MFKEELKKALQSLLLKILYTIQSRKFWALVFGALAILQKWNEGSIDPATAAWSLVGLVVAYSGLVAYEDVKGV